MNNPLKVSLENIIPLTEARDHFSQIVTEVQQDKLYVLTKGGKPAVAIIDVKYLETITGGQVREEHVEQEIQKAPEKFGRTPMIEHASQPKPMTPPQPVMPPPPPKPPIETNPPTPPITHDQPHPTPTHISYQPEKPELPKPASTPFNPMPPKPITPTPPVNQPNPFPKTPTPAPMNPPPPKPGFSPTPPNPQPKAGPPWAENPPAGPIPIQAKPATPGPLATPVEKPADPPKPSSGATIDVVASPDPEEIKKNEPKPAGLAPDDQVGPAQYSTNTTNGPEDMMLD